MSSSCISRYSNFLLRSARVSSLGSEVAPTVSTTSSGREESVAWTASSGFIFPETVKALPKITAQRTVHGSEFDKPELSDKNGHIKN